MRTPRVLLDSPALKFLRTLEIDRESLGNVSLGQLGKRGIFEWAAPELERRSLASLRRLRVGAKPNEGMHISETSNWMITTERPGTPGAQICRPGRYIGELSPALERMPNLRELHVTGEGIRIERLPARLTSLRLETRFLRRSTVEAIAAATLPELESLELWLGYWPDSVVEFEGPEGEEFWVFAIQSGAIRSLCAIEIASRDAERAALRPDPRSPGPVASHPCRPGHVQAAGRSPRRARPERAGCVPRLWSDLPSA
jgi:hypothetical protein